MKNDAGELFLNTGEYTSTTSFDYLGKVTDVRPEAFSEVYFSPVDQGEMFDEKKNSPKSDEEKKASSIDNEDKDQLSSFDLGHFSSDSSHNDDF